MAWFKNDKSHPFEVVTEVDGGVDDRHPCDTQDEAKKYYRAMQSQVLKKWADGDFITFDISIMDRTNDVVLESDDESKHDEGT
jgi:hypothetical protein